jgi:UDP-N-acetylglucosamine:LPS N-acetylglucosamine transferase
MPKSICFIVGGLAGGGQERALTYLANEFATRGNQISILCLFKTEIFFGLHPNIKVVWPLADGSKTNKFAYALKLIPYIRKNAKPLNPDSIISFGDWFNGYSLVATRFLNKPVYITN